MGNNHNPSILIKEHLKQAILPGQSKHITQIISKIYEFNTESWHNLEMDIVCQVIHMWPATRLNLRNCRPGSLSCFSQISFPRLIFLNLNDNYLLSIQSLGNLDAPNLQVLSLGFNYLYSVRSLRKMRCQKLKSLDYSMKSDQQSLTESSLFALSSLNLEVDFERDYSKDVRWLAKLQSTKMGLIKLWCYRRVHQQQMLTSLKRKWAQVHIGHHISPIKSNIH